MNEYDDLPTKGYVVIRCRDGVIVAKMLSFPECDRALMYRRGNTVSFSPILPEEIIGTPTLITKILERAGYRIEYSSDKLVS